MKAAATAALLSRACIRLRTALAAGAFAQVELCGNQMLRNLAMVPLVMASCSAHSTACLMHMSEGETTCESSVAFEEVCSRVG